MKVLIVSDIHANLPALDCVLRAEQDYHVFMCAGDFVGYYDSPNGVCESIKNLKVEKYLVRGNHDDYVLGESTPNESHLEAYRTEWTARVLKVDNRSWLATLPSSTVATIDGWTFLLHHADPWENKNYIYPDSHDLLDKIHLEKKQVMVLGHTHYPMHKVCGSGIVINPGSTGQPRDRNPDASYAIFDTSTGELEFKRTKYNVAEYQAHLTKAGWPASVVNILSRTND